MKNIKMKFPTILLHFLASLSIFDTSSAWKWGKCGSYDCDGKAACATVYQSPYYYGWKQCITFKAENDCVTLEHWWRDGRVSAINTRGNCIRLYSERNCEGISVDVYPKAWYADKLGKVEFDGQTVSISPCARPSPSFCNVTRPFANGIPTTELDNANKEMLELVDTLFTGAKISASATGASSLALLFETINFFVKIFNKVNSDSVLIDAKIDNEISRTSLSHLKAKMHAVQNRVNSLQNTEVSLKNEVIVAELVMALHTCEEIAYLFQDKHYTFQSHPAVFAPHFVVFSTLYYTVAKMVTNSRADQRRRVKVDMQNMSIFAKTYLNDAKVARKRLLSCKKMTTTTTYHCYSCAANRHPGKLIDGFYPGLNLDWKNKNNSIALAKSHNWYWDGDCKKCLNNAHKSVEYEFNSYFADVISKMEAF